MTSKVTSIPVRVHSHWACMFTSAICFFDGCRSLMWMALQKTIVSIVVIHYKCRHSGSVWMDPEINNKARHLKIGFRTYSPSIAFSGSKSSLSIMYLHKRYPVLFTPCVQWTPTNRSEKMFVLALKVLLLSAVIYIAVTT